MGKSSLCPGFRFYPTDEELVMYYLKRKLLGKKIKQGVIAEVKIYDHSPWDLPAKSLLRNGDMEWFFFAPRSRKYTSGSRTNRSTEAGYWKATGKDREVKYKGKTVAMIKTLIFHLGHPPKGERTNWVLHEYRMEDKDLANAGVFQEAYVLCKLFEKSGTGPQLGAHYGKPFEEADWDDDDDVIESSGLNGIVDHNASTSAAVTDITSIEPGPSIVTFSENARNLESSTVTCATKTLNHNGSGSDVMNMSHIGIGPSTLGDTHTASILDNNNNTQELEDRKGKKVMTTSPNEEDAIFIDLVAFSNLDDLSDDAFNMFGLDESADYRPDAFSADDLDFDLDMFMED